jgi:hypothetical protein
MGIVFLVSEFCDLVSRVSSELVREYYKKSKCMEGRRE